ncbi:transcriptional coactivator p15/PC4 family protein [Aspergillus homomorphus CBS 101889]|uniref:Transcriptional Coactivator p15 family protein n=1 Tax=Aspergillus homomorphus (strain CBS 101889) TaxID=1450537 RepID=A0A395I7E9_ASPHC|nr:transcriptional Coactivator p15 family protein [Aspergillus homomorphus CBS 101889]RAL15018.1 transcriptional Coactivator p15 family protein [Aspergillus homomorphus CBS 101889]
MTSKVKKHTLDHDSDPRSSEHRQLKRAKPDKLSDSRDPQLKALPNVDANGDRYWELSKSRRVTISNFRGKVMVNIREYYEKDGHNLPGRKGISLPIDQYSALVTLLPEIELAMRNHGQSVPRPSYDAKDLQQSTGGNETEEANASVHEIARKNIEATSDEGSGED